MRHTTRLVRCAYAVPALLAFACGGDSTGPDESIPTKIDATAPQTLSGQVGTTLSTPLAVRVTSVSGKPIAAVTVSFGVSIGNGTVNPTTAITNASGEASTTLTLGTTAGANEVTASAAGLVNHYTFKATGNVGPLARVVVTPRTTRMYAVGDTVRMRASVEDQYGNQTSSAVTWVSRDNSAVSVDATGLARAPQKERASQLVAPPGA